MPNNTVLSDVQLFPASSRGTHGMLDRLNLAFFSALNLTLSAGFALLVLCLLSFRRERCSLQALGAGCRHWGIPDAGTSSQVSFLLSGQTRRSSD